MILSSIKYLHGNFTCVKIKDSLLSIPSLNEKFSTDFSLNLVDLIIEEEIEDLENFIGKNNESIINDPSLFLDPSKVIYGPLYEQPGKIWGIGLNYKEHVKDLSESSPQVIPASFMKPTTTVIGHLDTIKIPKMSNKTTGEAELGIIIGKECKDIESENWLEYVAGFTTIIDVTAEDILRKNPRYLTLSKSFDTFFSFGPYFYTPNEISDIAKLKVATIINGEVWAENTVSNMTFSPDFLVSFHSKVMTLLPGDIISTGTPKATPIKHGDQIECKISGFKSLRNNVVDLKS